MEKSHDYDIFESSSNVRQSRLRLFRGYLIEGINFYAMKKIDMSVY